MAAWLTWLKSRLLLPDDEPDAAEEGDGGCRGRSPPACRLWPVDPRRRRLGSAPGRQLGQRRVRPRPERRTVHRYRPHRRSPWTRARPGARLSRRRIRRGSADASTYQPAAPPRSGAWQDALGRLGRADRPQDPRLVDPRTQFLPESSGDPAGPASAAMASAPCWPGWSWRGTANCACARTSAFGPILLAGALKRGERAWTRSICASPKLWCSPAPNPVSDPRACSNLLPDDADADAVLGTSCATAAAEPCA